MIDPTEPLLTFLETDPDYNESDERQAVTRLFLRQKAIDRLLAGDVDAMYVLDLLDSHGLDAGDWAERTTANLQKAVSQQIIIDPIATQFYSLG